MPPTYSISFRSTAGVIAGLSVFTCAVGVVLCGPRGRVSEAGRVAAAADPRASDALAAATAYVLGHDAEAAGAAEWQPAVLVSAESVPAVQRGAPTAPGAGKDEYRALWWVRGTVLPAGVLQAGGAACAQPVCVELWLAHDSLQLLCGRAFVNVSERDYPWFGVPEIARQRKQEYGVVVSPDRDEPPVYGVLRALLAWRGPHAWQRLAQANEVRFWLLAAQAGAQVAREPSRHHWTEWRLQICGERVASVRGVPVEADEYVVAEGSVDAATARYLSGQVRTGPLNPQAGVYP